MKNKKGVVLSLLMSLLVSGSSAVENSHKGNNSKGDDTATLEKRNNVEKGKTVAGYIIPTVLAFILGYKFGHRKEDVNAKEIQEGKQLNKCPLYKCTRNGKEFELDEEIYICRKCFSIYCRDCSYGKDCGCGVRDFEIIEYFVKKADYLPALRNVAKLAKYRFLMKAQEEQKKKNEELNKQKDDLNNIANI